MDKYDRQYEKYKKQYEYDLNNLDRQKVNLSTKEYWDKFKEITETYNKLIDELWAAKDLSQKLIDVKEINATSSKRERDYEAVLGQMKAEKLKQLIQALSEVSTINREFNLKQPFSQDIEDPLGVFEIWWDEELQKLPSIDEVDEFLRRISITSQGCIVFDIDSKVPKLPTSSALTEYRMNSFKKYKDDFFVTGSKNSKTQQAKKRAKMMNKSPLLAHQNMNRLSKLDKEKSNKLKIDKNYNILCSIVDGYELNDELTHLLYDHIENVCIPKGLIHPDEYRHMLNQFLRFVDDEKTRKAEVLKALKNKWRRLYYD